MPNKRSLEEELVFITGLKSLVVSNQELSVMQIQQIRESVLKNRYFTQGVSEAAQDVWIKYKDIVNKILLEKDSLQKIINLSISTKQGGWVSVLITPNRKLAGQIVPKLAASFIQAVSGSFSDVVLIGNLGKELYEQAGLKNPYTYFQIPDDKLNMEVLTPIADHLSKYGRIDAYYGYFKSLVTQDAIKSEITGEKLIFGDQLYASNNVPTALHGEFLFEPEPKEILAMIENQLLMLFFRQAVYESLLAQSGSRIMAMESALTNIDQRMVKVKHKDRLIFRSIKNKKQQQLLSGISLWT